MSDHRPERARTPKNEKRSEAREKARQLRAVHQKKERRNRLLVGGGIALAAATVIAVIALVLGDSVRPEGAGPFNMASDGIRIGEGLVVQPTPACRLVRAPSPLNPTPRASLTFKSLSTTSARFAANSSRLMVHSFALWSNPEPRPSPIARSLFSPASQPEPAIRCVRLTLPRAWRTHRQIHTFRSTSASLMSSPQKVRAG